MVREQKRESRAKARRPHDGQENSENLQARIAALRTLPREQLADAVFMLSMEARRQSEVIRHAVRQRAEVEIETVTPSDNDLGTYLASEAVSTLRHHTASVPTLLDALVQRPRGNRFTVRHQEAVALLAAMVWEQRLEGILEGLRLAGVLNEASRDRHAGFGP